MEDYQKFIQHNKKQHMAGTLLFVVLIISFFVVGSSVSFIEKNIPHDIVMYTGDNF